YRPPFRVIKHIEGLRTELEMEALTHRDVLVQCHVEVPISGVTQGVSTSSSKRQALRSGEGPRIGVQRTKARKRNNRNAAGRTSDQIRIRADPYTVTDACVVAVIGGIGGCVRCAGESREDPRILPASENFVRQSGFSEER